MAKIYISVGSNFRRDHYIRQAIKALQQHFGQITVSSVYESEAVGCQGNAFYNLVVAADTMLPLAESAVLLKQIENQHDRQRNSAEFTSCSLDLDLLVYDDVVCQSPVVLPRPEMIKNAHVLCPLAEIAADVVHPLTQKTYAALWQEYTESRALRPVPFEWSLCK